MDRRPGLGVSWALASHLMPTSKCPSGPGEGWWHVDVGLPLGQASSTQSILLACRTDSELSCQGEGAVSGHATGVLTGGGG